MDLPIYYTFSEFKENYPTDFNKWKSLYKEGSELDFVKELISLYEIFVDEKGNYKDRISLYSINPYDHRLNIEMSIEDYAENMEEKIKDYFSFEGEIPKGSTAMDFWEECNEEDHGSFVIDDPRHKYFKYFFISEGFTFALDHIQYRNFTYSVMKIYEFLQNKTKILKRVETPEAKKATEIPEFVPYQAEVGKGKNIPYKLALLRELGIMDTLNAKYDNNQEQLYRILEYLTGGDAKKYYLSMYGDNYNGNDRVTSYHTADLRKKGLI